MGSRRTRDVVNALELVLDADVERSGVWFTDVPTGGQYAADIDKLVTAGVRFRTSD